MPLCRTFSVQFATSVSIVIVTEICAALFTFPLPSPLGYVIYVHDAHFACVTPARRTSLDKRSCD